MRKSGANKFHFNEIYSYKLVKPQLVNACADYILLNLNMSVHVWSWKLVKVARPSSCCSLAFGWKPSQSLSSRHGSKPSVSYFFSQPSLPSNQLLSLCSSTIPQQEVFLLLGRSEKTFISSCLLVSYLNKWETQTKLPIFLYQTEFFPGPIT